MTELELLQLQSNTALIITFITIIGIVCCIGSAITCRFLFHNLHKDDWMRYVTIAIEVFVYLVGLLCISFAIYCLAILYKVHGG